MTPRTPSDPSGTRPSGEETPSFEQALERLEAIVEELEGGSLTLEESIARYEEGMKLSRRLTQTLDEAEKRIERLVEAEGGTLGTEPMELESEGSTSSSTPANAEGRFRARRPATTAAEPAPRVRSDPDELPF